MKNCSGVIFSPEQDQNFGELVSDRPNYMLPFGCRYRIIDFALSNMANYNLSDVLLYAGSNIRSTLDHVGDGSNWEMNRRDRGLVINPVSYSRGFNTVSEIESYFQSISYYEHSEQEHIYIENPMVIAKINLKDAYDTFVQNDDDVMLLYKGMVDEMGYLNGMRKLILDKDDGHFINVGYYLGTDPNVDLLIGRMFIKREVFIQLVKHSVENGTAVTLLQAILNHKNRLKVGTYPVRCEIEPIFDVDSYYRANMHLLNPEVYDEIFYQGGMVYTKSKDEPSTIYRNSSKPVHSLVANGCMIAGQVENSIIFRGVQIGKNAIVRNCIINQETIIKDNAVCVNVITDKYAVIEEGVTIAGAFTHPFLVGKDEVIRNRDSF